MNKKALKQLEKAIKAAQAKATKPNSFLCKIGFHDYYTIAESGFIMTKTYYNVCDRCGKYMESGLGVEGYC